jgi:hypothetical protein
MSATISPPPAPSRKRVPRPRQGGRAIAAARIAWGVFFAGCAVFNTVFLVPHARPVLQWCASVSWPGADLLVQRLILPVSAPFAVLVVGFELTTAVLLLIPRYARIGLALSLGWLAALIPFLGKYAIANVIALVSLLPLARRIYRREYAGVSTVVPSAVMNGHLNK